MDGSATDDVLVSLSVAEAMTVAAALRQYEPYWTAAAADTALEMLAATRCQIESVIGKLRLAASD